MAGGKASAIVALLLSTAVFLLATVEAVQPIAVFVFGDSTVDVGNNNYLPGDKAKANHPFYGVDYHGGVPTGRFSNGFNVVDFLAMMMGFHKSPPPYLSIKDKLDVLRGVNFASGGSGILDTTGLNVSLSMNTQIKYFAEMVEILNKSIGQELTALFLSKSVFIFSTANNDMFSFFQRLGLQNATVRDQFVSSLASDFGAQLQKIYEVGGRKFAVLGTSQLGCVPSVRLLDANGNCSDYLNDLSQRYNNATAAQLRELSTKLPGMKYSIANSYRFVSDVLSTPTRYGFREVKSACCGGGRLNAEEECTANATLCGDRRKYVFWDNVHPSQATSRLAAKHAYRGSPSYAVPVNLRDLVRGYPRLPVAGHLLALQ